VIPEALQFVTGAAFKTRVYKHEAPRRHLSDKGTEGDDGAEAILVALQDLNVVHGERLLQRGASARISALLVDEVWEGGGVSVGAALQVRRSKVVA